MDYLQKKKKLSEINDPNLYVVEANGKPATDENSPFVRQLKNAFIENQNRRFPQNVKYEKKENIFDKINSFAKQQTDKYYGDLYDDKGKLSLFDIVNRSQEIGRKTVMNVLPNVGLGVVKSLEGVVDTATDLSLGRPNLGSYLVAGNNIGDYFEDAFGGSDDPKFTDAEKEVLKKVQKLQKEGKIPDKELRSLAMGDYFPKYNQNLSNKDLTQDDLENFVSAQEKMIKNVDQSKERYKALQESVKKNIAKDTVGEYYDKLYTPEIKADLEKNSLITKDNFGGKLMQTTGQAALQAFTANLIGGGSDLATTAATIAPMSYGSALEEAYQEGADTDKARLYALGNTAVEILTEKITGGLPGTRGKGGLDYLAEKGINKISNEAVQELVRAGYKINAEGFEEGLSEVLDTYVKKATYDPEAEVNWNQVLESYVMGALSSGIIEAPTNFSNIRQGVQNQNIKTETQNVLKNNNNNVQETIKELEDKGYTEQQVKPIINEVLEEINNQKNESTIQNNENNSSTSSEISLNNINTNTRENSSNRLTESEIKAIAKEIANQQNNNSEQTVEMPTTKKIGSYNENANSKILPSNSQNISNNTIITNSAKNQIAPVDFDFQVENALNDNQSKGNIYIGKQTDSKIIGLIKKVTGIDVTGRKHILSKDYIRHLFKHSNETAPNQIPITKDDIKKIPDIVSNPDTIVRGSDTFDASRQNKIPSIRYIKSDNTGKIYVVEAIPVKGDLQIKTMWKEPTKLIHSDNTLHHTSETANSSNSSTLTNSNDTTNSTKSQIAPSSVDNMRQNTQNDTQKTIAPIQKEISKLNDNISELKAELKEAKKDLNPNEISQLTPQNASTTPKLPKVNRNSLFSDKESSFYRNATETSQFLSQESRNLISSEDDVKYYTGISNEETLNKAYEKLKNGGEGETFSWFNKDSKNATATDVAEGWILMKQYQDSGDYDSMIEVVKKMREMSTQAGQTVQAFNIMERLTPEGMVKYAQSELLEAYDKMVKNKTQEWIDSHKLDFDLKPEEVKFIMDTMEEVSTMSDGYDRRVKLAEIQKLMTDKLPPSKGAGIKSWMRISMLFNPKTQVRNVLGNAVIAPVNYFSDLFASVVDKQISKRTGIRTTGKTSLKSYGKGFKTGLFQSYNDFKKGINTRNIEGNRFEIGEGKSFNDKSAVGKSLNRVDSLLSFMLDAGDRGFYEASFTNSINNQMILNNSTEITQEMIDIATSEALQRTWQDNNNYTKFVLNARKGLNQILHIKNYGLGDVLIPFAKTPANLTKAIVDYSPFGLVQTINEGINLKRSLSNGQYTSQMQHKFVQDLGKATAGTMLYVLGYALAKAGIITGESDDDKDVSNFMKNTLGVSSYSITIGGKSFSYDWAQPVAAPLSIMANIVQKQNEGTRLKENILSSLNTAGNILLEQSFLDSLNTVFNNNDGIATGIEEAILDLPARAIPTFMKQIADMIDGTQRTSFEYNKPFESAINSMKVKIPFVSKTLAPTVDTMGREVQKYGGKNNIFNVFLNPANVNTENISESAEEIYRLYKETGDATIMPRVAPYYINQSGEKIILNSKDRAEFQKVSGNIIEENIADLLNDSRYTDMSDEEKKDIINNIINYSYNKAREEILGIAMSNQYNKVNEYTSKSGKVSDYYLNKEEVDYSLDNPEKYVLSKSITPNFEDYKEYTNKLNDIKSDKDSNGKTISNSRKPKVLNYINSLSLDYGAKCILYKTEYPSDDTYNQDIINYLNKNDDISYQDMKTILESLGMKVDSKGNITW